MWKIEDPACSRKTWVSSGKTWVLERQFRIVFHSYVAFQDPINKGRKVSRCSVQENMSGRILPHDHPMVTKRRGNNPATAKQENDGMYGSGNNALSLLYIRCIRCDCWVDGCKVLRIGMGCAVVSVQLNPVLIKTVVSTLKKGLSFPY